jgi:putative nucleotidyltransferase with HDIG domain
MIKERPLRIVLLEDNPFDAELISKVLRKDGLRFECIHTARAADFRDALAAHAPDLVISDFDLPQYSGFEALEELRTRKLDIPFLIVSGVIGEELAIEAFTRGATDCVNKNNLARLPGALRRAVAESEERRRRREAEEKLLQSYDRLHRGFLTTLQAFATALEFRDPYTSGHQRRVADLATAIARRMGKDGNFCEGIYMASIVHDIGKIYVPAEILTRPSRLNELEFKFIQMHVETGYEILKNIDFPWPIAETVYQHHERLDGSGYPRQLRGDRISKESRIVAVADVVEAMATHRPYRAALGVDAALAEVRRGAGTLYDTEVVDACGSVFAEGFVFK